MGFGLARSHIMNAKRIFLESEFSSQNTWPGLEFKIAPTRTRRPGVGGTHLATGKGCAPKVSIKTAVFGQEKKKGKENHSRPRPHSRNESERQQGSGRSGHAFVDVTLL